MAAPATHIVLAEKFFPEYFPHLDKAAFMVGTSFPDIRYLNVIEREKTHSFTGSIDSISTTNSFEAGVSFHVLVDRVRSEYMKKNNVYSFVPQSPFIKQAVRIYEDQVLCSNIQDWKAVRKYFDTIYSEELMYGITKAKVEEWHALISAYLSEQPAGKETITKFIRNLTLPAEAADEIAELVERIGSEGKVSKYVENFYLSCSTTTVTSS